ncbi:MAG: hypothetical protein AAF937_07680 [Planctomycetota bacterium]
MASRLSVIAAPLILAAVLVGLASDQASAASSHAVTEPVPVTASIALGIDSLGGPARGGPFAVAGLLLVARQRRLTGRKEPRPASSTGRGG